MRRNIATLLLALLLCSCATTSVPYRELSAGDERLADSAALALRVVIETADERFVTGSTRNWFLNRGMFPILHLLLESGESYRTLDITLPTMQKDWLLVDGRYRYSRDVVARVPLGSYLLRVLELYLGGTSNGHYYTLWYPRIGFFLSETRSYAMGTLFLDIDATEGTWFRDLKISSRLLLDQSEPSIEANIAAVADRVPSLEAGVQPLVVRYAYSLLTPQVYDDVLNRREDALWPATSSDRLETGFQGSAFYLSKKVSDGQYDYLRPVDVQRLPERYDIEWDARLINGEPEKGYGLMLGRDERNAFFFAASGAGAVSVLHLVDGAWQKRQLEPVAAAARTTQDSEANRFLVSVRGSRVKFSVNGESLVEFTSDIDLSQAFIAPYLASRGVLSISRFLITGAP